MTNQAYPVLVAPIAAEDGGGYAAYAVDLYGCMSDGETPEEAVHNVQDAIKEWCDEMRRLGRRIPEPGSAFKAGQEIHAQMLALIVDQSKLLKDQGEACERLAGRLDELEKRMQAAEDEFEMGMGAHWGRHIPLIPFAAAGRLIGGGKGRRH